MSISGKLVIAIAIAILASTATTLIQGGTLPDLPLVLAFVLATCASVLATHRPLASQATVDAVVAPGTAKETRDGLDNKGERERDKRRADKRRADQRPADKRRADKRPEKRKRNGKREAGQVKWFNASKGFGFITLESGDEVFVHFRSIRGEGRRSLRDGQRVALEVAQTEKGPQAEDVETLD